MLVVKDFNPHTDSHLCQTLSGKTLNFRRDVTGCESSEGVVFNHMSGFEGGSHDLNGTYSC